MMNTNGFDAGFDTFLKKCNTINLLILFPPQVFHKFCAPPLFSLTFVIKPDFQLGYEPYSDKCGVYEYINLLKSYLSDLM